MHNFEISVRKKVSNRKILAIKTALIECGFKRSEPCFEPLVNKLKNYDLDQIGYKQLLNKVKDNLEDYLLID